MASGKRRVGEESGYCSKKVEEKNQVIRYKKQISTCLRYGFGRQGQIKTPPLNRWRGFDFGLLISLDLVSFFFLFFSSY